jgi:hypothetical protein
MLFDTDKTLRRAKIHSDRFRVMIKLNGSRPFCKRIIIRLNGIEKCVKIDCCDDVEVDIKNGASSVRS